MKQFLNTLRQPQRWADFEIWLMLGLVMPGLLSQRLLAYALLGALLLLLARWASTRCPLSSTPANPGLLLLLAMLLVSTQTSAVPEKTYPAAGQLLLGIFLFFSVAQWARRPDRLQGLLAGLLGLGVGLAVLSPLLVNWGDQGKAIIEQTPGQTNLMGQLWLRLMAFFEPLINRLPAAFKNDTINFNVMAGIILLLLAGCLGYLVPAWQAARRRNQLLLGGAAAVLSAALIFTLSRGALVAMAGVAIFLAALRFRNLGRVWVGLLVVALALGWAVSQPLAEWISVKGSLGNSYEGRVEIWTRGLYLIQRFPFSGVGLGAFGEAADTLVPFQSFEIGEIPHSHNLFLQVALDLGLPGLLGWLMVCAANLAMAWQVYRRGHLPLGSALLAVQVALLIHGLWDAVSWGTRPAVLVWVIWGINAAAWHAAALMPRAISKKPPPQPAP